MSKKCTPLWREAHFQVKMHKTHRLRTTFGSWDVEKVHAVVARSTFPSQNVKKHTRCGPLLEVQISKKCTPLWREAHFQVKMHKTHQVRTTFGGSDVEKVHAVVARSTFRSEHVQSTRVRTTFGGSDVASLHYTTLHYTPLHCTALHYTTLHNTTTIHNYTPLHFTTLNRTTLYYITLHYATFHYTPLHYTTLRYTTYITLNDTAPQIDSSTDRQIDR